MKRCIGLNRNLTRCNRVGDWKFFCNDHRKQPIVWIVFIVFTVLAGLASIYSAIKPMSTEQKGAPKVKIGVVLGADERIGLDAVADCTKPYYKCFTEKQIIKDEIVFNVGSKGWGRMIFRIMNFGEVKLVNTFIHIWSPSPVSFEYPPAPNPKRMPRNVLEIVDGYDIYPFKISKAATAVPVDITVPISINHFRIFFKIFGDNMKAHEIALRIKVNR